MNNKIFSLHRLKKEVVSLQSKGKTIVFTNGCFDLIHPGHIEYLNKAKKLGDILILGVNSDSSIKSIKGPSRPINPLKDRLYILANLECVDFVCPFKQETPLELIQALKPDVLVKGGDWKDKVVVGGDFVKSYGGKVKLISFKKGYSTTALINKIKKNINGL